MGGEKAGGSSRVEKVGDRQRAGTVPVEAVEATHASSIWCKFQQMSHKPRLGLVMPRDMWECSAQTLLPSLREVQAALHRPAAVALQAGHATVVPVCQTLCPEFQPASSLSAVLVLSKDPKQWVWTLVQHRGLHMLCPGAGLV